MKTIKFRALDRGETKMYYSTDFEWLSDFFSATSIGELSGTGVYPEGNVFLMEFSGFKDRNGIDIYDGDILSVCNGSINGQNWMHKPYAVERLPKGFNMCMFCWDKNGESVMDSTHWCEVIGNIHHQPDLLTP